jgi:hypothetical protein
LVGFFAHIASIRPPIPETPGNAVLMVSFIIVPIRTPSDGVVGVAGADATGFGGACARVDVVANMEIPIPSNKIDVMRCFL